MKGQATAATVGSIAVVAVLIIVGAMVYGYAAIATPHDYAIKNETLFTGYAPSGATYYFQFSPVNNGSSAYDNTSIQCFNNSGTGYLYNGGGNDTGRYSLTDRSGDAGLRGITLTHDDGNNYRYKDVQCNYVYDFATSDQEAFHGTNVSNTGAGFGLLAVLAIVLAAVAIITIVALLKGG